MRWLKRYGRAGTVASYGASQLLGQVLGIGRGLILPNLLGPAGYGLVATLNAVNKYAPYASLGAHTYVLYAFPASQQPPADREETIDTIFTFTLLTSVIAGLFCLVYGALGHGSRTFEIAYGLATLALNPLASGLWRIHQSLLRIDERISLITRIQNAQAIVFFVSVIVLTYLYGIYGTFTGQLLNTVFLLVATHVVSPYRFRLRLDLQRLRRVLVYAIPMFFVYGMLETTIDSLNVFLLAYHLGRSHVGYYAIGLTIAGGLALWPKSMAMVFSTRIIREARGTRADIASEDQGRFLRLLRAHCLVFVAFVSLAYVFVPVVLHVAFPAFGQAAPAARLLMLAAYYGAIGELAVFVLFGQQRFNSYLMTLVAFLAVLFPVLWWVAPGGIVWVASATLGYRLVNSWVVLFMSVRSALGSSWRFVRFCVGLYALGLVPVALALLLDLSDLPVTRANVLAFVPQLVATFAVLTAALLGGLYVLHRQLGLLRELVRA